VIDEVADAEDGIGDYLSCQFQMLVAKLADIGLHVIVGAKDFIDGGDDEKGQLLYDGAVDIIVDGGFLGRWRGWLSLCSHGKTPFLIIFLLLFYQIGQGCQQWDKYFINDNKQ
jgi:hypothetical protein